MFWKFLDAADAENLLNLMQLYTILCAATAAVQDDKSYVPWHNMM